MLGIDPIDVYNYLYVNQRDGWVEKKGAEHATLEPVNFTTSANNTTPQPAQ